MLQYYAIYQGKHTGKQTGSKKPSFMFRLVIQAELGKQFYRQLLQNWTLKKKV